MGFGRKWVMVFVEENFWVFVDMFLWNFFLVVVLIVIRFIGFVFLEGRIEVIDFLVMFLLLVMV